MILPVERPGVIPPVYPLEAPQGCVLYLDMQDRSDKAIDHSRLGNHGAITGASLASAPRGVCRNFDGVDDVITVTGDLIGTGAVTIEAWINPDGAGESSLGRIVCSAIPAEAAFYTAANRLGFTSDSATAMLSAVSSITYGLWYHAVIVRAADATGNIYINGALNGTADQATGTPSSGAATLVGSSSLGIKAYDGLIGMLRIYSRVLTAVEVMNAYQEHAWRFGRG